MRPLGSRGIRLLVLAVAWAATLGCSSDTPLQVGEQQAVITFSALNFQARLYDTWLVIEDNDGDTVVDNVCQNSATFQTCTTDTDCTGSTGPCVAGRSYLWCETATGQNPRGANSVPWPFSIDISVIGAGETTRQRLTSPTSVQFASNVALYDTKTDLGAGRSLPLRFQSSIVNRVVTLGTPPNQRKFRFIPNTNIRTTSVRRDVMMTTTSPLYVVAGGSLGDGRCSDGNPGNSRIDGQDQPYRVTLNKGDTLIVEARMATTALQGSGLSNKLTLNPTSIAAALSIDGITVTPQPFNDSVGTTGQAIGFSFTVR